MWEAEAVRGTFLVLLRKEDKDNDETVKIYLWKR
jgi:hypothetical protein